MNPASLSRFVKLKFKKNNFKIYTISVSKLVKVRARPVQRITLYYVDFEVAKLKSGRKSTEMGHQR
jgi:hypothetical protein